MRSAGARLGFRHGMMFGRAWREVRGLFRNYLWPFVLRSTYDALWTERNLLAEGLARANAELRQHRLLLGNLQSGDPETTDMMARVLRRKEGTDVG